MTRRERVVAWALALSLALNVFVLARWLIRPGGPVRDTSVVSRRDRAEDIPGFRDLVKQRAPELGEQRRALRTARKAVKAALAADPYDAQRLASALDELRAQTARMQLMMHEGLLELAADLPAEQRARLGRYAAPRRPR